MEVVLPGGLPQNGSIERHARFYALTGKLEQMLIDSDSNGSRIDYVTNLLSGVIQSIGDEPVDKLRVSNLCVADRQYLMLQLGRLLDGEQIWLKLACKKCSELFDVDLRRCDLPIKPAGSEYPEVTLRLNGQVIVARVPTGVDQARIGDVNESETLTELLKSCILTVDGKAPDYRFVEGLSEAEIDIIDDALDEASPAVCNELLVKCPECKEEQKAVLDHYQQVGLNENYFYDEIHTLASHYHWSEADILDLPQEKRHRYLGLIRRSSNYAEARP